MDSIMTTFCTKVVEAGNKNGLKIGQKIPGMMEAITAIKTLLCHMLNSV
jgi:hypothetical protein